MFGLRENILGKKKRTQERVVIKDPETGNEVSTPSEIKRVSLAYLVNFLSNKQTQEQYAEELVAKKVLHFDRMMEVIEEDLEELSMEAFDKTLMALSKKPGNKYQYITKAGYSLKLALLNLFQTIWRLEKIPSKWHESNVIQVHNGEGAQNELDISVTCMTGTNFRKN